MKKGLRRAVNGLLCLCLVLCCLFVTAHAAEVGDSFEAEGLKYQVLDGSTVSLIGYSAIPEGGAVTVPEKVTCNGVEYTVTEVGENAFWDCDELTSVTLPDSLTSIGIDSFRATGLRSIEIPKDVTTIGNGAFWACDELTSVTLPASLTSIGEDSFRETGLTSIEIPEHVTSIASGAFMYCKDLTAASLPNTVSALGTYVFYGCESLASVNIPTGIQILMGNTFTECDALTSLIVPDNVNKIETYAITGCDKLINITLPENVLLSIYAIYDCNALTSITVPNGFSCDVYGVPIAECDSLETLIFADGVTELPGSFVIDCPRIQNIVIPASVTKVNASVSGYPEIPAVIHYRGTEAQWNAMDDRGDINYGGSHPIDLSTNLHFIVSENKPSTCKEQGYENKLICSADGCGYVYFGGTPLPLSEEHAEMDTATGKCTFCEKDIAVAKVEYVDGSTEYFDAQTLNANYPCYNASTFTMLKDAYLKQLTLRGGTFDLNGCTVTGYFDVRDTVTIMDSKGGGKMSSNTDFPVLVNGSAIVKSGSFEGSYADFKVAVAIPCVLDLRQYANPAGISVYIEKSEMPLYESIRPPVGYVLKDESNHVLPQDAVYSQDSALIATIAKCEGHDYELRIDENSIRGVCKHCLKENGVVKLTAEDCVYDGQPHGAAAQGALAEDWVRSLTYYDSNGQELNETPTNAGTYKAKLTCTAYEMTQSIDLTYTISPANIADHLRIYSEPADYDGQPKQAELIKMDSFDETQLVKDTDYTLTYEPVDAEDALVGGLPVNAGEYKVTVTGKGNYAGTLTKLYIGNDESGTPSYRDVMEIYPAWLFVEEDSVTAKDKVYDGTTAAEISMGNYSGVQGTDIVLVKVTGAFEDADAGENKTVSVTYTTYGEHGSNYEVIGPMEVKANISKRPMTVKISDQNLSYGEDISADAYDVTGLVEGQKAEVKLIPSTKVITESGTITAQVTVTADGKDVSGSYQITTVPGKLVITLDTSVVDGSKVETVNHTQQEEIQQILTDVEELLKSDELTAEEKAELIKTKEKADALLDRIEEAMSAVDTEDIIDTLDTTADNVKLEEKDSIQQAVKDLQNAVDNYSDNYTQQDIEDLQAQIKALNGALEALENAEAATALIAALPETVEPDDEEATAEILAAKAAYDALSDHEKSLVDAAKLNALLKAMVDYKIIKGDGAKWEEGSLSFTANGAFKKFVSVFVDGKEVDKANYTAKAGSTIITFKESYVETLSAGEHTITVTFTDGATSGDFQILEKEPEPTKTKPVNPAVPDTGDEADLLLWCSLMITAACVVWFMRKKGFAAK